MEFIELLKKSVKLANQGIKGFIAFILMYVIILFLIGGLSLLLFGSQIISIIKNPISLTAILMSSLAKLAILSIIFLLLGIIVFGIMLRYLYQLASKSENSINLAIRTTFKKTTPYLLTYFLFLGLMIIFAIPLAIPLIIFGIYWSLWPLALLIRDKNYLDSFRYSKELVKERWWKTFLYFVGISIIFQILIKIIGLIASILGRIPILGGIISIISSLIGIYLYYIIIAFIVIYFLSLEREKGLSKTIETGVSNQPGNPQQPVNQPNQIQQQYLQQQNQAHQIYNNIQQQSQVPNQNNLFQQNNFR